MKIWILLFASYFNVASIAAETVSSRPAYHPITHLWQGTQDVFVKDNQIFLIAGSTATVLSLAFFDQSAQKYFSGQRRFGDLDQIGNHFLGTGLLGATIGLVTLSYGWLAPRASSIDAGQAHLEALVANLAYTSAFKIAIRRPRPDSGDRFSFPSGHSSTMFCTAAVMIKFYGGAVGYPFLALAAFTGISRLSANRHYLSDVLFGATLGYIVGRSYSQHHLPSSTSVLSRIHWMPIYDRGEMGLIAQARF